MKKILIAALIISLAGCHSVKQATVVNGPVQNARTITPTSAKFATVNLPNLDQEINAEIGQTLIERSHTLTAPAIRLQDGAVFPTQNRGLQITITIPAGVLKKYGEDENVTFFQSSGVNLNYFGKITKRDGGVVVPKDTNQPSLFYWMSDTQNVVLTDTLNDAKFEATADIVETVPENFRKELLYTGISKNVISIVYREYSNDLARPAYTQDLKYDLGEGNVIGFKGARFKIIKATNLGITYKVLKYLD